MKVRKQFVVRKLGALLVLAPVLLSSLVMTAVARASRRFAALAYRTPLPLNFRASGEGEVRSAVEKIFQNLKDKKYEALYDTLPSGSRLRISRERFTSALRRSQDNYALERLEVGAIKTTGNFAVVDTVLYGRLLKPLELDGKIIVQQYLVREDGNWKVATGDEATIQRFLKTNATFARHFRIRPPRVFVMKDGKWVEFSQPKRSFS
jgi:hypothetical protein